MKFVISAFLLWQIFLNIPLFFANQQVVLRQGSEYTNVLYFTKPYWPLNHFLLYPWANFDGVHYLTIAGKGYEIDGSNARFLPLYPMLIYAFTYIAGEEQAYGPVAFFSALLLSKIFFLLSLILLYKLIRLDYSEDIAKQAILFLLLYPTSFFYAGIYSESLFLLLSLLAFYAIRQKKWLLAGLSGYFLTITRLVGIFIVPALLYEVYIQEKGDASRKTKSLKSLLLKLLKYSPISLIPLGFLSIAWFNAISWGNPLHFLTSHGSIGNSRSVNTIILFPQTIYRYIKILLSIPVFQFEWWVSLLELISFFIVAILLYVAWKKGIRISYIIFALLCFLVPTLSGTFTSLPRYTITLFPIFIALALIKNKYVKYVYAFLASFLLFLLLAFFARGYFIA